MLSWRVGGRSVSKLGGHRENSWGCSVQIHAGHPAVFLPRRQWKQKPTLQHRGVPTIAEVQFHPKATQAHLGHHSETWSPGVGFSVQVDVGSVYVRVDVGVSGCSVVGVGALGTEAGDPSHHTSALFREVGTATVWVMCLHFLCGLD